MGDPCSCVSPPTSTATPFPRLQCPHPPLANTGTPRKWGHDKIPIIYTRSCPPPKPPLQGGRDPQSRAQGLSGLWGWVPFRPVPPVAELSLGWGVPSCGLVVTALCWPQSPGTGHILHLPRMQSPRQGWPWAARAPSIPSLCPRWCRPLWCAPHWCGTACRAEDPMRTVRPGSPPHVSCPTALALPGGACLQQEGGCCSQSHPTPRKTLTWRPPATTTMTRPRPSRIFPPTTSFKQKSRSALSPFAALPSPGCRSQQVPGAAPALSPRCLCVLTHGGDPSGCATLPAMSPVLMQNVKLLVTLVLKRKFPAGHPHLPTVAPQLLPWPRLLYNCI